MPITPRTLGKKVIDKASDAMSFVPRTIQKVKGDKADGNRMALKMDAQTKHVPADPATPLGRSIIYSRNVAGDLRRGMKARTKK